MAEAGKRKEWDLTSSSALEGAAEWIRKKSGAMVVVAIRVDDLAIAADPQVAPKDVMHLLEDRFAEIFGKLTATRDAQRAKSRKDVRR